MRVRSSGQLRKVDRGRTWEPWRGEFIEVFADGSYSWHRCVICGSALRGEISQASGIGPDCARAMSSAVKTLRLNGARDDERAAYRRYVADVRRACERPPKRR